jgi:hypothetical protein
MNCSESKEEKENRENRENMRLLITIFFSILLALAFITLYETDWLEQHGEPILIHPKISGIFIIGIFGILFSSLEYMTNNQKWKFFAYLCFGLFITFLISLFLTYLNQYTVEKLGGAQNNEGRILLAKIKNFWIYLTMIMFKSMPTTFGAYITVITLIVLTCLKKSNKTLKEAITNVIDKFL